MRSTGSTQTSVSLILALLLTFTCQAVSADPPNEDGREPCIGLALGSGGAAGLAHIAVLEVFDEMDIEPSMIAGSSIGAVIGALYASGLSAEQIHDIFDDFAGSNLDLLSELVWGDSGLALSQLIRTDIDNGGLLSSQGFLDFLATKMEASTFSELKIPLKIVATDYWTGNEIVLDQGELVPAIQASMAVPGLFSPESRDDQVLIDGGTVNPLPYDLFTADCEIVIAVDVSGIRTRPQSDETGPTDVIFNSFAIMQKAIIAEKMKHIQPDIYIKPDIRDVRLLHFNQIKTVLEQAAPAKERLREELAKQIKQ